MLVFAHVSTQLEKETDSYGKVKYRGISTWMEYSHVAMVTHFLQVRQTLIAIPNHFYRVITLCLIKSEVKEPNWTEKEKPVLC